MRGRVIRSQSGFYHVETESGMLVCRLRGRLKRGPRQGDIIAVGDWVEVSAIDAETGVIEEVQPRQRMLSRLAPTPRGEYLQVIIANPDQVVFVFSCANPEPHLGMLDRLLVTAEKQSIPPVIVANKVDLVGFDGAQRLFGHYASIGYPVIYTSVKMRQGVGELAGRLDGKISVFAGPSGVGKSSLLNAVQPGLGLMVREVSQATRKGKHTTVVRELFPLEVGGYVADTPGIKALAFYDMEPEELDGYFPELRDLVADCYFNDCAHVNEPGCAVLAALNEGRVHPERYRSYLRMRTGDEED